MRRILTFVCLILLLAVPVSAFSGISSASNQTVVAPDGKAQVTMSVVLTLDSIPPGLGFPVPGNAENITVSGVAANSSYSGGLRHIDLSNFIAFAGTHTLVIRYDLPGVVAPEKETLILKLPLLCGFEYPIDSLNFSVTLPGPIENIPNFSSTYYPDAIETMMTVIRKDATVSGSVDQRLQDHETLTMILEVNPEMFPDCVEESWSLNTTEMVMICLAILTILYWLLFMRGLLPKPSRRTTAPAGITAGQIGCHLAKQGVDFTMMVLSWAQMGYILIQLDDNGRVLLHKRMDMGNERSEFENRAFRNLFGKRLVVDGTGYHYAMACRKASVSIPGVQEDFQNRTGSPMLTRILAAAVSAVSGISYAAILAKNPGWQVVVSILLVVLGFVCGWLIQNFGKALYSRHRFHTLPAMVAASLWFFLGHLAGEWHVALIVIVFELISGLGALFGGFRTDGGKQVAAEILGLRQYLVKLTEEDWKQILRRNPHYFYDIAPYAIALGIDRKFVQRLGRKRLPECPYLTTGMDGHLTAAEWNQLLRETITALDALQKRLPIDRMLGR